MRVGGSCGSERVVEHMKGWLGRTIHGFAVISWQIPTSMYCAPKVGHNLKVNEKE